MNMSHKYHVPGWRSMRRPRSNMHYPGRTKYNSGGVMIALLLLTALACLPAAAAISEPQIRDWRSRIERELFVAQPLPELRPEIHGRFEPEAEVIAERVVYSTAYGLRVPAILYRPKVA